MKQYYLIFIFLLLLAPIYSQNSVDKQLLFYKLDSIQGYKNLSILNGVAYREEYRTINERHPFFIGRDFYTGTLVYDNEEYSNIQLRYDMFNNILVAKIEMADNEVTIIQLITGLIDSFKIDNYDFENLKFPENDYDPGFYEIIYKYDCFKVYKKEQFKPLRKRDKTLQYYEFEKLSNEYIFKTAMLTYEPTNSNLIEIYPEYENRIKTYFKSNNSIKRKNYESFLKGLGKLVQEFECISKH